MTNIHNEERKLKFEDAELILKRAYKAHAELAIQLMNVKQYHIETYEQYRKSAEKINLGLDRFISFLRNSSCDEQFLRDFKIEVEEFEKTLMM